MNDLRKTFPLYTRNVAVSTGNNEEDYASQYGLNPGMKLFKQSAFIPSIFGPKIIDRKIFASKYSSNALVFERKDKMLAGGFFQCGENAIIKPSGLMNGIWHKEDIKIFFMTELLVQRGFFAHRFYFQGLHLDKNITTAMYLSCRWSLPLPLTPISGKTITSIII